MDVNAKMVMALREKTGLPMMDCKKALSESGGDEDQAIEWLRKQGRGRIEKMASREASEGRIACFVDSGAGGIVELRCETAPVANTEDFIKLALALARAAAQTPDPAPEKLLEQRLADDPSRTVGELMHDVFNRLRENIQVQRAGRLEGNVGYYVHHNGQVGVLVQMNAPCPPEAAVDVCMHIAAMKPRATRREDVSPLEVERERAAFLEEAKGKPAAVAEKMVTGKLARWYSEFVLLEQAFIKDDKKSVSQMLADVSPGLSVNQFLRYEVGGI